MAIIDNYEWGERKTDPDTGESYWDLSSLWDAISSTFPWKSVTGNTSEKIFHINDTLAIRFVNFDNSGSSRKASVVLANTNSDIKTLWQSATFTGTYNPKNSIVQIITSITRDRFVRLRPYIQETFIDNSDFVFGVVKTIDGVTKEQTGLYGIYIPQNGGVPFDYSPQYLITEDTTNAIANTGYVAGASATTAYKCIINPDAPFTALSPIITVGNKNISQTSYVMMIGKSAKMGPFILDGKYYYGISGFCMYDGDVGDSE